MLSILIPTYNYNIVPLVREIRDQVLACDIAFEILVYDDGSQSTLNIENKSINLFENCIFKELPNNIGRSAIRNLLAQNAKHENLVFLDADAFPKNPCFIENYLNSINKKVVIGGITHTEKIPEKPFKLRWLYTKIREQKKGLHSSNFFIQKKLLQSNPFDENLTKYGCEDVLFFNTLINKNIPIHHIDNPIIHNGNDDSDTFIKKTEQAVENLLLLLEENKLKKQHYKVSVIYNKLKSLKLEKLLVFLFKLFKPLLHKNFNSNFPSIFLYDFYRLGYFCFLKTKT